MELVFIFCNPLLHNIIQVNCLTSSVYASVKVISFKKKKKKKRSDPHLTPYAELGRHIFSHVKPHKAPFQYSIGNWCCTRIQLKECVYPNYPHSRSHNSLAYLPESGSLSLTVHSSAGGTLY